MNTQQAIAFFTNKANTLTQSLTALGLGNNGETVVSLQTKVDQAVKTAFGKREQLSSKLDTVTAQARQSDDELSLAVSHQSIEQERLAELQRQQEALEITIQGLQDRKLVLAANGDSKRAEIKAEISAIKANITKTEAEVTAVKQQIADGLALVASYDSFIQQAQSAQEQANYHNQYVQYWGVVGQERGSSGRTKDIYGWITNTAQVNARDSFQAQANQFTQQATAIQGQVDSFKQSLSILEQTKNSKTDQVWLYYQELDAKNNVLFFASTQSGNDLALLDLQLSQSQTDLTQLKDTDIPSQKTISDGTNQRVAQVQFELDEFKTQKISAQQRLDSFNQSNEELLTTDLSLDLLQASIAKSQANLTNLQGDLAKLKQSIDYKDSNLIAIENLIAIKGAINYKRGNEASSSITADFNGDGLLDVFNYHPGTGKALLSQFNVQGEITQVFNSQGQGVAGYDLKSGLDQALAFDYNGDGKEDLFLYRPGGGAAFVARSNEDGSFTTVYAVGDDGAAGLNGIAGYDLLSGADRALAFDYNGDGKQDLFLYRPGQGAAWVAHSSGDGSFTAVYAVGDDGAAGLNGIAGYDLLSGADRALAFDYNGDGKQDLFLYT